MARAGALYSTYNGAKLEYSATENGDYTQIYGIKTLPDLDGDVNYVDTTDLDNTKQMTQILGLKSAVEYEFEFNCEDVSNLANIKLADDLENSGLAYYWKLTLPNGIVYSFQSDVRTKVAGGSSDELIGFSMFLSPISEPVRTLTIPTSL